MSNLSINTEIITTIVAIAALLLSIFNFIVDRIDKKPKLIVVLSQGNITTESRNGNSSEEGIFVEVINSSHYEDTVTNVNIRAKGTTVMDLTNFITDEQQSTLERGENAIYQTSKRELSQALKNEIVAGKVKIRALARNALGKTSLSNTIIIDTNQHSLQ
ncbi:MAG TPA: hypothetical protein VGA72_12815 [Anaerolineales bacterium]